MKPTSLKEAIESARILLGAGQPLAALEQLNALPTQRSTASAALLKGRCLYESGQAQLAFAELDAAIERFPGIWPLLRHAVKFRLLSSEPDAAQDHLARLDAAAREGEIERLPVIKLWQRSGRLQHALALAQSIPMESATPEMQLTSARLLLRAGRGSEAEACLRLLIPAAVGKGARFCAVVLNTLIAEGMIDEASATWSDLPTAWLDLADHSRLQFRLALLNGERETAMRLLRETNTEEQQSCREGMLHYARNIEAWDCLRPMQSSVIGSEAGLQRLQDALIPPDLQWSQQQTDDWVATLAAAAAEVSELARPTSEPAEPLLTAILNAQMRLLFIGQLNATLSADLHRAAARLLPALQRNDVAATRPPGRIRIALLFGDGMPMHTHLLIRLDPRKFEVAFFHTHGVDDAYVARLQGGGFAVTHLAPDWSLARTAMLAFQPDVLLTAHCSGFATFLMHQRIAAVQCVWYEPPLVDGAPHCDYYISWAAAEPTDADMFYRTGKAFLTEPPYWIDTESHGQPEHAAVELPVSDQAAPVFVCAGTPRKFSPRLDGILAQLMEAVPSAVFCIPRREYGAFRLVLQRLLRIRSDAASRIRFLPRLSTTQYDALLQRADCVLDTVPLGGMSSALHAASIAVPKVCMATQIPFGLWGSALSKRIGVAELVAESDARYVELAAALVVDPQRRRDLGARMRSGLLSEIDNDRSLRGFANFLCDALDRASS